MSLFNHITEAPLDPIFSIELAYRGDQRPNKQSLAIGVYRVNGRVHLFEAVSKAEQQMAAHPEPKEYLFFDGDGEYVHAIKDLVLGQSTSGVCAFQTIGGTGALRLSGDFLVQAGWKQIYVPAPTWGNHRTLYGRAGMEILTYPYVDIAHQKLLFDEMVAALEKAEPAVVLFHGSCHNPTGIDPTLEQWKVLAQVCQRRRHFVIFDSAYQGFGDGLDQDVQAIRLFVQNRIECGIAVSFSKSMGLYGERVGALLFCLHNADVAQKVASQVRVLIRTSYSNPPRHGAHIARLLLTQPDLTELWRRELEQVRLRIVHLRGALAAAMGADYQFLTQQRGLFCCLGLPDAQVEELHKKHALYVGPQGRLNITGLTDERLPEIAKLLTHASQATR